MTGHDRSEVQCNKRNINQTETYIERLSEWTRIKTGKVESTKRITESNVTIKHVQNDVKMKLK